MRSHVAAKRPLRTFLVRLDARAVLAAATLAVAMGIPAPALADPLNALDFPSLGTGTLASGTYTINTDDLTLTNSSNVTLYTGTLYANSIAVFAFNGLNANTGSTINVIGKRPLAILSSASMTISGTINLNGADGNVGVAGAASGAPGGGLLTSDNGGGGDGGMGGTTGWGAQGSGTGAGWLGTGGGFGGKAYDGGYDYGNLLVRLEAGSGGTGGYGSPGAGSGGGGGGQGGGALELGAQSALTLTNATITAIGGAGVAGVGDAVGGGGGSGGGVLLHARNVTLPAAANRINASGGSGVNAGGGGGGRVTIQSVNTPILTGVSVAPGVGGASIIPFAGVITSARVTLTTTTLDFGSVPIGSSKTLGMLISNAGDANTALNGVFPTATAPFARVSATGAFSALHTCEYKAATYTFSPTSIGPFSQTLIFASDGGNSAVTIRGDGVPATTCPADFDGDGTVDFFDYDAFVMAFETPC